MSANVKGSGWITDALAKVPAELHLPGYNFCGPNTKLQERLERGDVGVNPLDDACLQHDVFYSQEKDAKKRHEADKLLADKAWKRVKAPDAKLGEKLAAMLVTGAMKAKVKVGGGLKVRKAKRGAAKKKKETFAGKLKVVKKAVKNFGAKDAKAASKVAYIAAKKVMKGSKATTPRVIPVAKRGGILPLIPAFAGLSALGALLGGASSVYKTVKEVDNARKSLNEMNRHNEKMEAIAIGNKKTGSGFYMKPYKNGYGIYTKPKN